MVDDESSASGSQTVPWARQAAASAPPEPVTQRARRMVQGLPDWEPLPPGEAPVSRRGRD